MLTSSDCDFFIILTWFLCLHHGWGGYSVKWFLVCFEKWNMIRSLHRCFILKMYQILYAVPVWFDLCSLTQLTSEINYSRILRGAERRAASETRRVTTGGIPSRMVAISFSGIISHSILDLLAMLTISCSSYSFMFKKFNPTPPHPNPNPFSCKQTLCWHLVWLTWTNQIYLSSYKSVELISFSMKHFTNLTF